MDNNYDTLEAYPRRAAVIVRVLPDDAERVRHSCLIHSSWLVQKHRASRILCIPLGQKGTAMMGWSTFAAWRKGHRAPRAAKAPPNDTFWAGLTAYIRAGTLSLMRQSEYLLKGDKHLVCRGTDVLVHYWYYPDSYDRCIPASEAPETLEPDKRIKGEPPVSFLVLACTRLLCGCLHDMLLCDILWIKNTLTMHG